MIIDGLVLDFLTELSETFSNSNQRKIDQLAGFWKTEFLSKIAFSFIFKDWKIILRMLHMQCQSKRLQMLNVQNVHFNKTQAS